MESTNKKTNSKKHWLVLAGACGMIASSLGFNVNSIGVFFTPVADALGVYRGNFAFHSTIATFAMAITYLFLPRILERVRFKPLLFLGVTVSALSTMAMALTTNMFVFYILGAIRGFSSGVFGIVPVTMLLNNWFEDRNGTAMSIAFASSGVSGAFMSPLFTHLITNIGWQETFVVAGILIALLNIPGLLFSTAFSPKEAGFLPYKNKNSEHTDGDEPAQEQKPTLRRKSVSYTSIGFITLFMISILYSSLVSMVQHFPGLAESLNFSISTGAAMLSAAMIGNILFKLLAGTLSDKIGIVKSFALITVLNLISLLLMVTFQRPSVMIGAAFIFGSIYAFSTIILPLLSNEFFGRSRSMRVYPIFSFVGTIGKAISLSLIGYAYDFTSSYMIALFIAIIFQVINLFLLYLGIKAKNKSESFA